MIGWKYPELTLVPILREVFHAQGFLGSCFQVLEALLLRISVCVELLEGIECGR